MPPVRPSSSASSSGSSSGSSGSSGSDSDTNSSDSSSSGSSGSSSSATASSTASRRSRVSSRSARRSRSTSSSSSTPAKQRPKAEARVEGGSKRRVDGNVLESSSKKGSKKKSSSQKTRVGPQKSATAKPIREGQVNSHGFHEEAVNNSDSDQGDFSLPKLAARASAAKAKKAASSSLASTASSAASSASNTPNPTLTPNSNLGGNGASMGTPMRVKVTSGASASATKLKSIFSGSSESESEEKRASVATSTSKKASVATSGSTSVKSKKKKQAQRSPSPASRSASVNRTRPSSAAKIAPATTSSKTSSTSALSSSRGTKATVSKASASTASKAKKVSKKSKKHRSSSASSVDSKKSSGLFGSSSEALSSSRDSLDEDSKDKRKTKTPPKAPQLSSPVKKKGRPVLHNKGKIVLGSRSAAKTSAKKDNLKKALTSNKQQHLSSMASSDSEPHSLVKARPNTRQARGGAPKRSKHVTGKRDNDSENSLDSEPDATPRPSSEQKKSKTSLSSSPPQLRVPPIRKTIEGIPPIETSKCPVAGCDSSGHLGGRLDHHFTLEACPVYHRTSRKQCKDARVQLNKQMMLRQKALTALATKSPGQAQTSEQRKHAKAMREARASFKEEDHIAANVDEHQSEDREIDLRPYASAFDLKLFQEAQALSSEDYENGLKGLPDTKATRYIQMGKHEMEVWYQSPYPEDLSVLPKLYICEFCLKAMKCATTLNRHAAKCVWKHPPGDEIYRRDKLSVFEICGRRHKQFCQSLCLLAKFFLDHKTLYFDVEPFLFYVMTTADAHGCHMVGYFSKEKNSFLNYNVSCILTLPPYQRQGFGRLLIDFSYLLTKKESKVGSPEKPLSDLGLMTYRAYWKDVLLEYMCTYGDRELSLKSFCEERGINSCDIVSTLQYLGMIKYWRGQHIIVKKEDLIKEYLQRTRGRQRTYNIHPEALKWKPYEPTPKERKQAERIKKNQEERLKKR